MKNDKAFFHKCKWKKLDFVLIALYLLYFKPNPDRGGEGGGYMTLTKNRNNSKIKMQRWTAPPQGHILWSIIFCSRPIYCIFLLDWKSWGRGRYIFPGLLCLCSRPIYCVFLLYWTSWGGGGDMTKLEKNYAANFLFFALSEVSWYMNHNCEDYA